jgi:hypothetical protein
MASIEQKVTTAILTAIRSRREAEGDSPVYSMAETSRSSVREVLFSDFEAVTELKCRWGLSSDSLENWERLWRHNPALRQFERPMGWVLEADGRVVGYLGNIALLYRYGDRTLTAVASHGLVIEPGYRGASLGLVAAFYRQESVDLYLVTTAIETVGKIARVFKSDPLPQADYDTVLFWVLQPRPFAAAVMKKMELTPAFSWLSGVVTSVALKVDGVLRRRRPGRGSESLTVTEVGVGDIGDEFQLLWEQKLSEKPRLLADRSPAALRWHFRIPGDPGSAHVLCCHNNKELLGYAVIRNEPGNQATGLRRSIVADMLAKEDDPEVFRALCSAAYDQARRAGSHVFEVLGFPESVRKVCSQWHPYTRKYPACPFYYKASDPKLHEMLSDGLLWYASPFDGDTTLWSFATTANQRSAV